MIIIHNYQELFANKTRIFRTIKALSPDKLNQLNLLQRTRDPPKILLNYCITNTEPCNTPLPLGGRNVTKIL